MTENEESPEFKTGQFLQHFQFSSWSYTLILILHMYTFLTFCHWKLFLSRQGPAAQESAVRRSGLKNNVVLFSFQSIFKGLEGSSNPIGYIWYLRWWWTGEFCCVKCRLQYHFILNSFLDLNFEMFFSQCTVPYFCTV